MTARAPASRQTRDTKPMLQFPCGHVEPEREVERRTHLRAAALWVQCGKCNLIALMVGDAADDGPRRPSA